METRRSSSSNKRPLPTAAQTSSSPSHKRSKVLFSSVFFYSVVLVRIHVYVLLSLRDSFLNRDWEFESVSDVLLD